MLAQHSIREGHAQVQAYDATAGSSPSQRPRRVPTGVRAALLGVALLAVLGAAATPASASAQMETLLGDYAAMKHDATGLSAQTPDARAVANGHHIRVEAPRGASESLDDPNAIGIHIEVDRDLTQNGHGWTARNRPNAQSRVVVQTQDLSNLTHRQPPLCHRDPLPKGREDHTCGRLSRVVSLRCSDPSHRSSAHPKSDRHGTGISDRHRPESVIGLQWNQ